jgi:rhodanese-related sulfurtransferase
MTLSPEITMEELLRSFPGAQRALFRNFHIGGCASCGFQPREKLSDVCARNGVPDPDDVLEKIREAHEHDERVLISPAEASAARRMSGARLIDIRTREEFDAVHIDGSELFSQDLVQKIMGGWARDAMLIIVDHNGSRSLDAAAYFSGHGFTNVRALRGGIDAWSLEVDASLKRYAIE